MSKEDYVSFETAKLLKEKGFDFKCDKCYAYFADDDIRCLNLKYPKSAQLLAEDRYPCVTLQMAMKWLREVHNIMVSPYALSLGYYFEIFDLTDRDITGCKPLYQLCIPNKKDVLSTYEEAAEVGIRYYLDNMLHDMNNLEI